MCPGCDPCDPDSQGRRRCFVKLTETAMKKLTPQKLGLSPGQRKTVMDDDLTGFGVRVSGTGHRSFFVTWGPPESRKKYTIGRWGVVSLEQARKKAKDLLAEARIGDAPVPRSRRLTVGGHATAWLEHAENRKKAPAADRRYMKDVKARWGSMPLVELTRDQVLEAMHDVRRATQQRHADKLQALDRQIQKAEAKGEDASKLTARRDRLADREHVGHTQANRFLASVRACFADAVAAGTIKANPAGGIKPFRENPPRARVLSEEEMGRLVKALDAETDPHVRTAFRLLIETGARRSEVLRARWSDFDLDAGLWRIPSPKAGHPQVAPLTKRTVALLSNTPRVGEWLVPGRDPAKHRADLVGPWRRLVKAAKLEGVTVHDIRRSFGLEIARKAGLHVASKLLRHADVRVTERVYAPLGIDDLRKAAEEAQRVEGGEVVDFPTVGGA